MELDKEFKNLKYVNARDDTLGPWGSPKQFARDQLRRNKNRQTMDIALQFLDAAKNGDALELRELLKKDAPVNCVDPVDRAAALHYVAAYDARPALRVILKSGKLDHLVRDRDGRLPSELAREFGRDDAMARLLMIKEMRQAEAEGVDPAGLYKISARKVAAAP